MKYFVRFLIKLILSSMVLMSLDQSYNTVANAKSIIIANYHNVLLFFPKEYGGNDDIRVIFDVRNITLGTFKYIPVIVDVAYDSTLNNAYCYMESAVTSYIMLLKWAGGKWCYQILFDFPSSQFSKYMYHSIILVDNFLYWTTDRYVMSGRLPGYDKRLLLQPSWNRLYSMTEDKKNNLIYIAAFDFTENALFKCNLRVFSCVKLLTTAFTINYVYFNGQTENLYVATIQDKYLYQYDNSTNSLSTVQSMNTEIANIIFLDDNFAIYTNQQTINIKKDIMTKNVSRKANAKLIDPYALQYIFTFNQVVSFDSYPYPYHYTDYHDLLYRNSLFLFYFYICGMDYVENDNVFLPQMDMNNQFLRIDNCQTKFLLDRDAYLIPSVIAGSATLLVATILIVIFLARSRWKKSKKERNLKKGYNTKKPSIFAFDSQHQQKTLSAASNVSSSMPSSDVSFSSSYNNINKDDSIINKFNAYTTNNTQNSDDFNYLVKEGYARGNGLNKNSFVMVPPPSSEMYDINTANISDIDYTKQNDDGKSPKTYSTGFYILRKNSDNKKRDPNRYYTPQLASISTGSTPTITQNSTDSATNAASDMTLNSDSSAISSSILSQKLANTNPNSHGNKVKFNEFEIQHHYDQYDDFPSHSKIYNQSMINDGFVYDYDDDENNTMNNKLKAFSTTESESSADSSGIKHSTSTPINTELSKRVNMFYNGNLISQNIDPSNNYVNVIKAVDFNNNNNKKTKANAKGIIQEYINF